MHLILASPDDAGAPFPEAEDSDKDSEESFAGENSAIDLAVRRAFLTSITETRCVQEPQDENNEWTNAEFLSWLDRALDLALAEDGRAAGARIFWHEWALVEKHVRTTQRKSIICFLDGKLGSQGFPRLRGLV